MDERRGEEMRSVQRRGEQKRKERRILVKEQSSNGLLGQVESGLI